MTPPDDSQQSTIRILFAGTTFVVGGAEIVFAHLLRGFRKPPYEVELLALRELGPIGEQLKEEGVPTHSEFTGSGRLDPFLIPKLRGVFTSGRYDVIYFLDHAHAVFYGTLASFGRGVKVRLMPVHTTRQADGQPSLKKPIRLVKNHLDRIISIAEAQKQYLVETEGWNPDVITVIHNGVPILSPDESTRLRLRDEVRAEIRGTVTLGVPDVSGVPDAPNTSDVPVVGITAVLRPEKNHELLLRAFARVLKSGPAELWVVGDGPRRSALESMTRELGIEASVRFLGQRSDARHIMSGFDVAVLSSHPLVETQPLSLIEAMDAGNAVVATRVGALAEMVEEGENGLLVDPGDEAGLAAAIDSVIRDPGRARRMGERGQEIAKTDYSVETMVRRTEELIKEVLAGKS